MTVGVRTANPSPARIVGSRLGDGVSEKPRRIDSTAVGIP